MRKKIVFGLGILVVVVALNVKFLNNSTQDTFSLTDLVMANTAEAEASYPCPNKSFTSCWAGAWVYPDRRN